MELEEDRDLNIALLRGLADFQFYQGAGSLLFQDDIFYEYSRYLKRPKRIYSEGALVATLSTRSGILIPTMRGAELLKKGAPYPRLRVVVSDEAAGKVSNGMSVFSKFVVDVDPNLRHGDEVLVTNTKDILIATGRMVLSPLEIKKFKRGIAVKVRDH